MSNYLLDTSAIVHVLRGDPTYKQIVTDISAKGTLSLSIITYGELMYGTHKSPHPKQEKYKLDQFIADLHLYIMPLTVEAVEVYAQVKRMLEQEGQKLDEFDLLIGATSVTSKSILVTDNYKHFSRFPNLLLFGSRN